jgi:isopenicillin-N N-acyltransferase like protein
VWDPGTTPQVSRQLPQAGVLIHTNHFLDLPRGVSEVSTYAVPDSIVRLGPATALMSSDGAVWNNDRVEEVLADQADWPNSICCHPDPRGEGVMRWATVLAVVTSPAERRLWLASGNPCTAPFEEALCADLLDKETPLGRARARAITSPAVPV